MSIVSECPYSRNNQTRTKPHRLLILQSHIPKAHRKVLSSSQTIQHFLSFPPLRPTPTKSSIPVLIPNRNPSSRIVNSPPPSAIPTTSARNPCVRIPNLPTLTNRRRRSEVTKVRNSAPHNGVEVQPVADGTRVALGFQRRDGSVGAWRVQVVVSAVGSVIASGEAVGRGGVVRFT